MREYETIYILKPDLPADQISTVKEKIDGVLKKGKAHILSHADWGKRKLAYPVQKLRHAHYFYLQYLVLGPEISELERILKFDDSVLKFLTVKLTDNVNVEERVAKGGEGKPPPEDAYSYLRGEQSGPSHGKERWRGSESKRYD